MQDTGVVTQLLAEHRTGDESASQRLYEIVYDDLREMAHRQLRFRKPGETLNTTGLVHEAYLKMFDRSDGDWKDRAHFFAVTARAMRQILVDYARRTSAEKRGGKAHRTDLHASLIKDTDEPVDILDLEEALQQLQELKPRLAQIVECRFFGGLSIEETAEVLGMSSRTVDRDWYKAKSFLYLALSNDED
ncbi:MAG: ECF-type sigma factor [Rhodothermia bacterium]|nr:MAG: ECF-type sigma factor [Rhodothermia bacterium]